MPRLEDVIALNFTADCRDTKQNALSALTCCNHELVLSIESEIFSNVAGFLSPYETSSS